MAVLDSDQRLCQQFALLFAMAAASSISPRPRSARTRGLAVLLLVAFAGSNLASYIHEAVERHARCPEHGELIHVSSQLAQVPDAIGGTDQAQPGAHARPAAPGDSGHEHEHCYLCPNARDRMGLTSTSSALASAAPFVPQLAMDVSVAAIRADIYILAPKTSPPV